MLTAEIIIERSPKIVWAYFTETKNWEKWRGGVKAAQWRKGGKVEWELGGSSPITDFTPGKMVQIAGSWMDTIFTLEPTETEKTVFRMQEGSPKGGASFNDGGAAELTKIRSSLAKFKEHVERETKQSFLGEKTAKQWWEFWK